MLTENRSHAHGRILGVQAKATREPLWGGRPSILDGARLMLQSLQKFTHLTGTSHDPLSGYAMETTTPTRLRTGIYLYKVFFRKLQKYNTQPRDAPYISRS